MQIVCMYECITECGESAVLVSGARGKPAPDHYKVDSPLHLPNPHMTLIHCTHMYVNTVVCLCSHNRNGLSFRG